MRVPHGEHARGDSQSPSLNGLTLSSRRNMLKAGLASVASLSPPHLWPARADAARRNSPASGKSAILL